MCDALFKPNKNEKAESKLPEILDWLFTNPQNAYIFTVELKAIHTASSSNNSLLLIVLPFLSLLTQGRKALVITMSPASVCPSVRSSVNFGGTV